MDFDEIFKESDKEDLLEEHLEEVQRFNDENPQENNKGYKSKDGFVYKPVLRGFTEIKNLFYMVSQYEAFICGGYVRYMASENKNPVIGADVDIYCKDEDTFKDLKSMFSRKLLNVRHENEISITYTRPTDAKHPFFSCPPIQLIKPVKEGAVVSTGSMEEVLSNFDFTVIRCGLVSESVCLVDADFEHDEQKNILRLKNIHCPVSSTLRCMKYSRKGYWLPPMQVVKLLLDWEGRDDSYRSRIVEFLEKANEGTGLSQEEVDELESLMRID